MNRWLLGFPEQATAAMQDALRLVGELRHPQTTGLALSFSTWLQHQRGEHEAARQSAEQLTALSEAHGFRPYLDYAAVLRHVYDLESTDVEVLRQLCNRELAGLALSQWRRAFCICVLAERCAQTGHANEARSALATLVAADLGTFYGSEIARVEGELILKAQAPDAGEAEKRFRRALEIARARAMKSFELRAAMSLARLWRGQGRRGEARELLAPLYGWFTEGFDTADLRAAKALLEELK
jgi:hypothetical protein